MEDKEKTVSLDRRNILLGGTALVAVSAVGALSPQASAQQAMLGRKPNILMHGRRHRLVQRKRL